MVSPNQDYDFYYWLPTPLTKFNKSKTCKVYNFYFFANCDWKIILSNLRESNFVIRSTNFWHLKEKGTIVYQEGYKSQDNPIISQIPISIVTGDLCIRCKIKNIRFLDFWQWMFPFRCELDEPICKSRRKILFYFIRQIWVHSSFQHSGSLYGYMRRLYG